MPRINSIIRTPKWANPKKPFQNAKRHYSKFYNSKAWRTTRINHLNMEPLCRTCSEKGKVKEATTVDHIIPMQEGGAKLNHSNLQSLCKKCHNRKTAQEIRERKRLNNDRVQEK